MSSCRGGGRFRLEAFNVFPQFAAARAPLSRLVLAELESADPAALRQVVAFALGDLQKRGDRCHAVQPIRLFAVMVFHI